MEHSFFRKLNKHIKIVISIPVILSIFLTVGNIILAKNDIRKVFIYLFSNTLFISLVIVILLIYKKTLVKETIKLANNIVDTENLLVKGLNVPLIIINKKGTLLYGNKSFYDNCVDSKEPGENIYKNIPELKECIDKNIKTVTSIFLKEKRYRIDIKTNFCDTNFLAKNDINYNVGEELLAVYFYDETMLYRYIKAYEEEKMDLAIIHIDNYDEITMNIDEVKKSLLIALIDRKITKFFSDIDGVVKKIDADKYFVIFMDKFYDALKENKFDITESVKEINVGNSIAPTISIGIGRGCKNYKDAYNYSANSIDMALSRGGDQVVVRGEEGYTYFGGKTEKTYKTSRVKARIMANNIKEYILKSDKVIITGHKLADVDCIGASIGMYRLATSFGKEAYIIINETTVSTKPLLTSFMENPVYPKDMFISSNDALLNITNNTLLIVVDTNNPLRIESRELIRVANKIIVIDHHRQSEEYIKDANVSYIEPYASSASELVAQIIEHFSSSIKLLPIEAESLYSGILLDTNNFLTKTGVRTFETAAYLKRCGADLTKVRKLFRDDKKSYKAKAEVVRDAYIYKDDFAISIFPDIKIESPTIIGAQAANELLNIDGIKASFVITKYNGKIYLSARSIDEVNVQVICEKLGGGGHMSTAGTQFDHTDIAKVERELKNAIDNYLS